jgi:hypothetical protein
VPETKRHLLLRTALFQILALEAAGRYTVGSDQFVYWNARDPGRKLAPDVFVHTGYADHLFDSWKTWERGAPQLGVEIVSESDDGDRPLDEKLERYQEAGFEEVVRFDPSAAPGYRLRVWDRIEGDLVERVVHDDRSACDVLGLWWLVRDHATLGCALRLSRDAEGNDLLPEPQEQALARGEARGVAIGEARGVAIGEARGVAIGEARGAIEALCEVFAIELTPDRRAELAAASQAELHERLAHLKRERGW